MSTLEKSIQLLNSLPERELNAVYDFILFVHSRHSVAKKINDSEPIDDVLNRLAGSIPDSGKTLDKYRSERIMEKYEIVD